MAPHCGSIIPEGQERERRGAKIDIRNAFRLIPVHPADRHLLAMEWNDQVYIDTCLPFGLRSAPKLINIMADLLAWILRDQGVSYMIHYLDDYLTAGAPGSPECLRNLRITTQVCQALGVPLALEKVAGPAPVLEFVGILLDMVRMEARLPEDKLVRIHQEVTNWLGMHPNVKSCLWSACSSTRQRLSARVVRSFGKCIQWQLGFGSCTCLNKGFR